MRREASIDTDRCVCVIVCCFMVSKGWIITLLLYDGPIFYFPFFLFSFMIPTVLTLCVCLCLVARWDGASQENHCQAPSLDHFCFLFRLSILPNYNPYYFLIIYYLDFKILFLFIFFMFFEIFILL